MKYIKQVTLCGMLGIAVLPFNAMGTQTATKAAHEITGSVTGYTVPTTVPLCKGVLSTAARNFDLICKGNCQLTGGTQLAMAPFTIPNFVQISSGGIITPVDTSGKPMCSFTMPGGHVATVTVNLTSVTLASKGLLPNGAAYKAPLNYIGLLVSRSGSSSASKYLYKDAASPVLAYEMTNVRGGDVIKCIPRLSSKNMSVSGNTFTPVTVNSSNPVTIESALTGLTLPTDENKTLNLGVVYRISLSLKNVGVENP